MNLQETKCAGYTLLDLMSFIVHFEHTHKTIYIRGKLVTWDINKFVALDAHYHAGSLSAAYILH
jgi:hypothetical protein